MIAAAFCNPEVVDILIEVGSNINTRDGCMDERL